MVLSLLLCLLIGALLWQRRRLPAAQAMIALAAAGFMWTLGFLLETYGTTLEQQLRFDSVGYIGSMSVPVAWLVFALQYVSGSRAIRPRTIALLSILPVATMVLVWTNGFHHLMWSNERLTTSGPFLITAKTYAPFFWVAMLYNYVLILTGAVVLVRRLFVGAPLYTAQAVSLIVAVSLPLAWNFIYVFDLVPLPRKDLTPVMFAISGIAIVLGLMRFHLFEAIPFARKFVIEHLSDGVAVFDNRDRLLDINPAATDMLGLDTHAIGRRLEEIAWSSPVLHLLVSERPSRVEMPVIIAGQERFCELETIPMRERAGRQAGWLAIMHDVTERKQAEKKLGELYAIEQQQRLELEEVAQERGLFINILAHELWTPLTPVIASMTLLDETLAEKDPDCIEHRLSSNAMAGIQALASCLRDLLDLAKYSRGGFTLEKRRVDVKELIVTVAGRFEPEARKKSQQIMIEVPDSLPEIEADGPRLEQVLINLLSNASKFSGVADPIFLRALTRRSELVIEVEDRGIGMTEEEQRKLFRPYHRVRQDQQRFPGLGLGLSISKQIVESHGGRMWLRSEQGKGSTFSFSLPLGIPPGDSGPSRASKPF